MNTSPRFKLRIKIPANPELLGEVEKLQEDFILRLAEEKIAQCGLKPLTDVEREEARSALRAERRSAYAGEEVLEEDGFLALCAVENSGGKAALDPVEHTERVT
jgi:hypothetical protein